MPPPSKRPSPPYPGPPPHQIADRGARALARVLDASSVISILDLSENQLHQESGKALGRALRASRALISLNLRLNRLGDVGCKAVLEALRGGGASGAGGDGGGGAPLERLNLAANGAGVVVVGALVGALQGSRTLVQVGGVGGGGGSKGQVGPQ